MNIGKNIAALRKKNGMTQEELANKLNVSAQAVSKWENESSCPDISLLEDIADIFSVSVDALIRSAEGEITAAVEDGTTDTETKVQKTKSNTKVTVNVERPGAKPITVTLPMAVIKTGLSIGKSFGLDEALSEKITDIAESEQFGEILSIDGENGEHITIKVE